MNKGILAACAVLLTLSAAFLIHRIQQKPLSEEIEDGAVRDNSDPAAPKQIESTEITAFSCCFSVLDLEERGELGSFDYYTMKAQWTDGIVEGFYYPAYHHGAKDLAYTFQADASFMEQLQKVVAEQNLVQHNGWDHAVSGLPDQYGADLSVSYASGERIDAIDNQDNFLSMEAMGALIDLFSAYAMK